MKAVLARLDRLQQRYPAVSVPISVFKRFGEHGGGRLSATISYWSFFSIFPLMLAFVTVLNIVLQDDPETRRDLVDGALGQVPVIGNQLSTDQAIGGSWIAIAFGLAAAIWTGLAAAMALQFALNEVWDVPVYERPNGAIKRLKALGFLVVLAIGVSLSTLAANVASILDWGVGAAVAGVVLTFVVDAAIVLFAFFVLVKGHNSFRKLLPGTIVAGIGLTVLQLVGSWIVRRYISGASDTYGTFAIVIALLSWFFLLSRVVLLSAELNAVLANRVNPRSLLPDQEMTDGDRRAAELDAQRVVRDERLAA